MGDYRGGGPGPGAGGGVGGGAINPKGVMSTPSPFRGGPITPGPQYMHTQQQGLLPVHPRQQMHHKNGSRLPPSYEAERKFPMPPHQEQRNYPVPVPAPGPVQRQGERSYGIPEAWRRETERSERVQRVERTVNGKRDTTYSLPPPPVIHMPDRQMNQPPAPAPPPGTPPANVGVENTQIRTLRVWDIPKDMHVGVLDEHFGAYGSLVSIQLKPLGGGETKEAFVQFVKYEGAHKALISPASVGNNRFIKLDWASRNLVPLEKVNERDYVSPPPPRRPVKRLMPAPKPKRGPQEAKEEEKANEGQKPQETMTWDKLTGLKKQHQIELQKEALVLKRLKTHESFLAMLKKSGPGQEDEINKTKQEINELKESLKKRKEEVARLSALVAAAEQSLQKVKLFRPPKAMKIDMRPRSLKITQVPQEITEDKLREHLQTFGKIEELIVNGELAVVKYENRQMAERALITGRHMGEYMLHICWTMDPKPAENTNGVSTEVKEVASMEDGVKFDDDDDDDCDHDAYEVYYDQEDVDNSLAIATH